MIRFMWLFMLMGISQGISAQLIYNIEADSVRIFNGCDTAELILENHTQHVSGFLFNKGRGRTEFRKAVVKINDTTYVIGGDTLKSMPPGISWLTTGNSGTNAYTNFLGTIDTASLVFRTNNLMRARVTGESGNVIVGNGADNGARLQVNGRQTINGDADVQQLLIKLPANATALTPVIQVQSANGDPAFDLRQDLTNLSLGAGAGKSNVNSENKNIAIGRDALASNTTGSANVSIGYRTLFSNISGSNNIGIGTSGSALYSNTTGWKNIALGTDALYSNTTGEGNVGIGYFPMKYNVTGSYNVGIGSGVMQFNTSGSYNVALGGSALSSTIARTSSSKNVAIGMGAAQQGQVGNNNVFLGYWANFSASTGNNNIVIGSEAVSTSGESTLIIGTSSGTSAASNTTVIGHGIAAVATSNVVILGRSDQNTLIGGAANYTDNGARLQITGSQTVSTKMGIGGVTSLTAKLHVAGSDGSTGNAPIKLTAGTLLASPEDGAIEFDGTDLYVTENTTRYKLSKTTGGQLTTDFGAPALTANNSVTTSLSVAGAQPGDVVAVTANTGTVNPPSIIISAYVTSANTVTIQAYNAGNSTVTLASANYKVRVIR